MYVNFSVMPPLQSSFPLMVCVSRFFPRRRWLKPSIYRGFRSKAALSVLARVSEDNISNLVLYNYPSIAGAICALFARLYHSRLSLPLIILPFSSFHPFRIEDFKNEGLNTCYLLDFIGPKNFAQQLSELAEKVVIIDHHKASLSLVSLREDCPQNVELFLETQRSSAHAAYDYFALQISEVHSTKQQLPTLVNGKDVARIEMLLNYIEDANLHQCPLSDTDSCAFNIGLKEERLNLNCTTNPCLFDQLLDLNPVDLIVKGNSIAMARQVSANRLLTKTFKIRLGRGFYGECLGMRADGHSDLTNEIGKELSLRSAAAGLRPIGAVVYMQRGLLKVCLRTNDSKTDTSEIAKAYSGGGHPSSSSFSLPMNEYNKWVS